MRRIGIDVGGTNTDAVLMDGTEVLAEIKTATTKDVTDGVRTALDSLLHTSAVQRSRVSSVMIGTTQFMNAIVEARRLLEVATIRLGLPATAGLPPLVAWPEPLRDAIGEHVYLCRGGREFDGRPISTLDEGQLRRVADDIAQKGLRTAAISAVFSPINDEDEHRAAEILREAVPELAISFSSDIGRLGLLERENAAILNACLADLAVSIVGALRSSLTDLGLEAPVYLSQNDGTLMSVDYAERHPVATFASGPTNSMRGAALLSDERDCAVIDIGGTTSDIGVLVNGFPRESKVTVNVAGVRTNFRMPDVVSLGIGGGSLIHQEEQSLMVGPDSVGYELSSRALVFGGDTRTASDIAVAAGHADVGDPDRVAALDREMVRRTVDHIERRIAEAVDRMKAVAGEIPVVVVGGGSILLRDRLPGATRLVRPDHHAVANAVGAAIAQVGGEVDQVFSVGPELSRAAAWDQARELAAERAVAAGAAAGSVEVVDGEELALSYVPGNALRIKVRAVGDLELRKSAIAADH